MKNLIIIAIAVLLATLATCNTLHVSRTIDVKTNSKKVIIKGDVIIYVDSLRHDSL